ncbi:MAG: glycosyltransferase family 39 protein [Deltaproteobacteria bacterium]|nr:glycosyltransferase family 39 protein [Deltaproteobacteria bacterium]
MRRPWILALIFLLAVAAHIALAVNLREASPGGLRADENVYLELASTLWREGTYGAKVSVTYPPGYPMVAAPAFAIASNGARFAVLRTSQALALALASLLLLPMLRSQLSQPRAWMALAALQLVAGAVFHGVFAQSESLYLVLLVAATGGVWIAWSSERAAPWLTLGALAGFSVATRRMGVVVPVALGMLLALDAWQGRREGSWRLSLKRAGLLGAGAIVGLLPEFVAAAVHGEAISPYESGAASGHLGAGLRALTSVEGVLLLVKITGAQLAWPLLTSLAAPLLVAAVWLDRRLVPEEPDRPTARVFGFVMLSLAGSAALTILHIVRYQLGSGNRGWDVYPRYLDPLELPLLAAGVLAVVALRKAPRPALRSLIPWGVVVTVILVSAGPLLHTRGGRMVPPVRIARGDSLLAPIAEWLIVGGAAMAAIFVLALLGSPALRARVRPLRWLAGAMLAGWLVSAHMPPRLFSPPPSSTPKVLRANALTSAPTAPLGVVVHRPGPYGRHYYEPAFRSDHPVWFLAPGEVDAWRNTHRDGFVLVHRKDRKRASDLRGGTRAGDWTLYPAEASP